MLGAEVLQADVLVATTFIESLKAKLIQTCWTLSSLSIPLPIH